MLISLVLLNTFFALIPYEGVHNKLPHYVTVYRAEKPIGGVSTFILSKQPSLMSDMSGPTSPASLSPMSSAEQKPLLKHHDSDSDNDNDFNDEPVVFNFGM